MEESRSNLVKSIKKKKPQFLLRNLSSPVYFHDLVAFWLESTLSNASNDLRYMRLVFSDHKYELHNHMMLQSPLFLVLIL
jgi:hypothetical protein